MKHCSSLEHLFGVQQHQTQHPLRLLGGAGSIVVLLCSLHHLFLTQVRLVLQACELDNCPVWSSHDIQCFAELPEQGHGREDQVV